MARGAGARLGRWQRIARQTFKLLGAHARTHATHTTTTMSVLAVVEKLHQLAEMPENRSMIAHDPSCLGGLIQFMQNRDVEVSALAIETLMLLAAHDDNKVFLYEHAELTSALEKLLRDPCIPQRQQLGAHRLFRQVRSAAPQPPQQQQEQAQNVAANVAASDGDCASASAACKPTPRGLRSTHATPRPRRTDEWVVRTMTSYSARENVRKALVGVQGVISVTINPISQRVTVFGNAPVEAMEASLADIGMEAVRSGVEMDKENGAARHVVPAGDAGDDDDEQRRERARREQIKEQHRSRSLFSRIGRALYIF